MCRAVRPTAPSREYWWVERASRWAQPGRGAHPARSSTIAGRPGVDPGNEGHAGAQPVEEAVRVVDNDFNGNTLNHFGEVSGGIVGRQERELRTGTRRKREYMAAQPVTRESIDGDLGRLVDGHVCQQIGRASCRER